MERVDYFRTCIAEGGMVFIGHGGWVVHMHNRRVSGYDIDEVKPEAIRSGCVVVDVRTIEYGKLVEVVLKMPILAVGEVADPLPYHSLSKAPLDYIVGQYRAAGAEVYNYDFDSDIK